jgi:hypothetical protein
MWVEPREALLAPSSLTDEGFFCVLEWHLSQMRPETMESNRYMPTSQGIIARRFTAGGATLPAGA